MNKFLTILFLLLPICVLSQDNHISGMLGLNFGLSKEDVIVKMASKGYSLRPEKKDYLSFNNVKFGAFEYCNVAFYFINNKFYQGLILVAPNLDAQILDLYKDINNELSKKYGKGEAINKFEEPYKEGDGQEVSAIKLDKAKYYTFWTADKIGSIKTTVSPALFVSITYQDKSLIEEVITEQAKQISNDY